MTEPGVTPPARTSAGVLLSRKLLAGLSRLIRYLGPLLLAALAYLARLAMEVVSQARLLLLSRRRRREPQRAVEHGALEQRLRETGAQRWHSWRQLPSGRRIAIFHLWFVDGGDLLHRTSSDGKQWFIEDPPSVPIRDFYPGSLSVFRSAAGTFEAISENSQGNQFVHYVSDDGNEWRVVSSEPHQPYLWPRTTTTLARRDGLWVWLTLGTAEDDRVLISLAHMKRRP